MNKKIIKSHLFLLFKKLWFLKLIEYKYKKSPPIFYFHRFHNTEDEIKVGHSADLIEKLMVYAKQFYKVVTVEEIISNINSGSKKSGLVAFTIDDGYSDFRKIAYPIIKKINVPACLFITTGFIDGNFWLWPDKIEFMLKNTKKKEFSIRIGGDNLKLNLDCEYKKNMAGIHIINQCKKIMDSEKEQFIKALEKKLDVKIDDCPPECYSPLSWKDIREMSDNGIEIGCHTITHPILSKVTQRRAGEEINRSKKIIEKRIGKEVKVFCYPNGRIEDYNLFVENKVKEAGYRGGVTTIEGRNKKGSNVYSLRRYSAPYNEQGFIEKISGFGDFLGLFKK